MSNDIGDVRIRNLTFKPGGAAPGILPVGAVIPISSNIAGSYSLPSSGAVDGNGFMLCDGAVIPGGQGLSGNTPNLSDSRFLMGSSTSGTPGGQTNVTLATTNLPSHTHDLASHTHTMSSHTHDLASHTHTMKNHTHGGTTGAGGNHSHSINKRSAGLQAGGESFDAINHSAGNVGTVQTNGESSHTHSFGTGGPDDNTSDGPSNNTSGSNNNATAGPSNNTSGSTGSATAYENRPLFLSVVYLIRVA